VIERLARERIGLGADVLETEPPAGFGESSGSIAGTIIGHDALDRQAQARIVGDRRLEERNGALLTLVLHDRAEGNAGGVVNANVDKLPTCITGTALFRTNTHDAMADAIEFAKLFDVDVDQFAGIFSLIAAHRFGRLQRRELVKAEPAQDPADSCWRDANAAAICLPVWRCRRKASTATHVAGGVWLGNESGLEERSRKPSMPSARKRSTHLATVPGVVLN
jgi:hypothetical protein